MGYISDAQGAFSHIYSSNTWGAGSGVGSLPDLTRPYIDFLQAYLRETNARSVVDFGCGDWQVSGLIDWSDIRYCGFDVVDKVIHENVLRHRAGNISFEVFSGESRLPAADLLVCKEVFQHLPTQDVLRYLKGFKEIYPKLLITNDVEPAAGLNTNIRPGEWRPLRLDQPPFSEKIDILLEWDVDAYGCHWRKQTVLILGNPNPTKTYIQIPDTKTEGQHVALARLQLTRVVKKAITQTPVVGPLVRSAWRALRGSNQ